MPSTHKDIRDIHIVGDNSREWRLVAEACPAMASRGLLWTGWTDARWGYRFVHQAAPFAGVVACQEGLGHAWAQGRWQACGPGRAYVLPRGIPHAYHADRKGVWRVCWVALEPSVAGAINEGEARVVEVDPRPLRSAIDGLHREVSGPADPQAVQRWVELIQLYALRMAGAGGRGDRLGRLWAMVDADLAHCWSLEEMAEAAGVSDEHLRRLCQISLQSSPVRHLTRLRMRRAAALLIPTSQKIAVIARAVGYENAFAFSSCFSRHMGISPAGYRAARISQAAGAGADQAQAGDVRE